MKQLVLLNPVGRRRLKSSRRTRRNPIRARRPRRLKANGLFDFLGTKKKRKHRRKSRVRKFFTKKRKSILLPFLSRRKKRKTRARRTRRMTVPLLTNPVTSMRHRKHPKSTRRRRFSFHSSRRRRTNPVDVKQVFSENMIGTASGLLAGTVLTDVVLGNFAMSLPGSSNPYAMGIYRFLIPLGGAVIIDKTVKNNVGKSVAEGLVLAGLVNGARSLFSATMGGAPTLINPTAPASTNAYLGAYLGRGRHMNAYLAPTRPMGEMPRIVRDLPVAMNGAFKNDAWNVSN